MSSTAGDRPGLADPVPAGSDPATVEARELDARLVHGARDGDRASWDHLVARHSPTLWAVARGFRLDAAAAADVVQTSWLRLVEHLGSVREPERVGSWLTTTARRECLAVLRQTGRTLPTDGAELDTVDPVAEPLDAGLLRTERDAQLWAAFATMPDRCRRLLRVLAADPPPSYEQVAAAFDMPVGSIGPTRGRCLRRLRTALTDQSGADPADRSGAWAGGGISGHLVPSDSPREGWCR